MRRKTKDEKAEKAEGGVRAPIAIAAIVLFAAAIAVLTLGRDGSDPGAATAPDARPLGERVAKTWQNVSRPERPAEPVPPPPPVPGGRRARDIDGDVRVDGNGDLVVDRHVLRLFDSLSSAIGDEPDDVIRSSITAELRKRLPPEAAAEAEVLLEQYLSYRDEARELVLAGDPPHDLDRRLQWLRELRRDHFSPEVADALFGEQETIALLQLEQREVMHDESLDPAQRQALLRDIEDRYPEHIREARERQSEPWVGGDEVEAIRDAGGGEQQIFGARERRFGTQAAERLAEVDIERAEWSARFEDYGKERDALLDDDSLTPEDRAAHIEALRAEHFHDEEILRVRALDGIPEQPQPEQSVDAP